MNSALLRGQIALVRHGLVAALALALLVVGSGAWLWTIQQTKQAAALRAEAGKPLAPPAPVASLASAPGPEQNLANFYATLGDKRDAEQQLKTIFALAEKSGLALTAGQYHAGFDLNGRFHTYQVSLPVKGSYRALWQFCLQTLATVPFAALDEISVRRESIGEPMLEARVRFTLYLKEGGTRP